jgi:hypothetical protein
MSTQLTAAQTRSIAFRSLIEGPTQAQRLGPRFLHWLIKVQKQRAERLIQMHPEWRPVPWASDDPDMARGPKK